MEHLLSLLEALNNEERGRLAAHATLSTQGLRRHHEDLTGYRQHFALDADRILHSRAYTRYIDKTQVFSCVANDHITHRVLHVQLVARVARTIGRFLRLNEDLIEAIALGHDIGHPPFGHTGEHFLSHLCLEHGLPPFQHNIQSVRFLDQLERKGQGWNLTVQTLDGILCHDGEIHSKVLEPQPDIDFAAFDDKLAAKEAIPNLAIIPATLEGCVVRLADTVSYIGRDIEDAITLGMIERRDIPRNCRSTLGHSNGTIVYTLVTDLITNSRVPATLAPGQPDSCHIGFSDQVSEALRELKEFNYAHIYLAPETQRIHPQIEHCYRNLFAYYLECLYQTEDLDSLDVDLMRDMSREYLENESPAGMVRDFIAGMTDNYFLQQASSIGCSIPETL